MGLATTAMAMAMEQPSRMGHVNSVDGKYTYLATSRASNTSGFASFPLLARHHVHDWQPLGTMRQQFHLVTAACPHAEGAVLKPS
jgi:hypothetical protein